MLTTGCHNQLETVLRLCNNAERDSIVEDIVTISTRGTQSFTEQLQQKLQHGSTIYESLQKQIATTNARVQEECAATSMLQEKYDKLLKEAAWTQEQKAIQMSEIQTLRASTSQWITSIQGIQQSMECTRQFRSKQVQRLQHQLSLYASTTGIKWHYSEEEKMLMNPRNTNESGSSTSACTPFLVGEVNVAPENMIRHFKIDRQNQSRYEIANELWSIMNFFRTTDEEEGHSFSPKAHW